ncbi:MAG: multicomponent Na+:H+ antiporter subunit G [Hyphomicrobiaceae bacterium]
MIDVIASLLLLAGTFFMVLSSVGLIRLPDVYGRLHAVTKASTLGMAGILSAAALYFYSLHTTVGAELIVMAFVMLTNPVGGHMIARAAYLTGVPMTDASVMDEMRRAGEMSGAKHDQA